MTATTTAITEEPVESAPATTSPSTRPPKSGRRPSSHGVDCRVGASACWWASGSLVVLFSLGLVLYALEPMFQQQTQSRLLSEYRAQVSQAANEAGTLAGVTVPTQAPELGAPVAIVEIGGIHVRQVVVEGAGSAQTQAGPGHVPGTAGPGQPGNSVIVGRRGMFGGPFGAIDQLQPDDTIVVTTTQGQSVYRVTSVAQVSISNPVAGTGVAQADGVGRPERHAGDRARPGLRAGRERPPRRHLRPDDRGSPDPGHVGERVRLATPRGPPSSSPSSTARRSRRRPQGGRSASQTGLTGDSSAWAGLLLAMQGFVLAAAAAVFLYRRLSPRSAYLLTMPALLAFAVLAAEAASRLLPAWT